MGRDPAQTAAAPYTRAFLTVYDAWVIQLSNRFAWRCNPHAMLDQYNQHLGRRHLEVGPGSGWYLVKTSALDTAEQITLMDLNPTPLSFTARRLRNENLTVETVCGSILEPVPAMAGDGYDSAGLNFVLHCVPDGFAAKGVAFRHLASVLTDDGVLFGSTILGRDRTPRNLFGRVLSTVYTRVGAFNNRDDDRAELEVALQSALCEVTLTDIGDVTLFTARKPRR